MAAGTLRLREGVELALLRAIQELPGRQPAVLIFRDVLGWTCSRGSPSAPYFTCAGRDRALVHFRGLEAIRRQAEELIGQRLADAEPRNDGRQTPYRGHPVFVAQHATATCCRGCLERNHRIARGHELSDEERRYVVDVIMRWIERDVRDAQR
jgi:predicted Fe-S protein YdhL (DUF1289 family)